MTLTIICIDCEALWDLESDPTDCICDDPRDDAWVLFVDGVCATPTSEQWKKMNGV